MNRTHRPFGIYCSTDQEGVWMRIRSFHTMSSAMQSLGELTKTPIENRRRYIILPNQDDKRGVLFKGEQAKQVFNNAR